MSDFLISFDPSSSEKQLLELLKGRYPKDVKIGGSGHKTNWGAIAVLENVFDGYGPVSDLETLFFPLGRPRLLQTSGSTDLGQDEGEHEDNRSSLRILALFKKMQLDKWANILNGEFCLVIANLKRPSIMIVTDPMNTVRVYMGLNKGGTIASIGTQPDLVAYMANRVEDVDIVSAADVLLNGRIISFPYSLYKGIVVLSPASINRFDLTRSRTSAVEVKRYWQPLCSGSEKHSKETLAEMLRTAIRQAVGDAVEDKKQVGVFLSGGLDSRVVLAAIPNDRDRTAVTVCDVPNFETDIAGMVAGSFCARRVLLRRDNEYYGNLAFDAIRLAGGDPLFLDSHFLGFRQEILKEGLDVILGGYGADTLLKGHYCSEPVRFFNRPLPRNQVRKVASAVQWIADQSVNNYRHTDWAVKNQVIGQLQERHMCQFEEIEKIRQDGSAAEWIEFWPSPELHIPNVSVHRRLFPKTEVYLDKRILEVAAVIPQGLKVNATLFKQAALPILGDAASIPLSATRQPVSTPPALLLLDGIIQKGIAKAKRILYNRQSDGSLFTDGSWPNWDWYWQNSVVMKDWKDRFSNECPGFLRELLDLPIRSIFSSSAPFFFKYRLLHLCIWDLARRVER